MKISRSLAIGIASLSLLGGAQALVSESALAVSAPITVTGDVNLRAGPSSATARVGGIFSGTTPQSFNCWTQGMDVGGVDVWFNVTHNGVTGFYASYFDNSHYATDAQITSKYGIPPCGAGPVQTVPATAAQKAVAWARPFADRHDTAMNGLCLTFVFRAYEINGANLRAQVDVPINANTYPQDIWGHFARGQTGGGVAPAGALVFFKSKTGRRDYSHVALSLGGGNLVSTSDSIAGFTHYETIAQHNYSIYQGWWLPA